MITIGQAQKLLWDNCGTPRTGEVPLLESLGYYLVEDIVSGEKLPAFDNSAMDGYAIRSSNTKSDQIRKFKIISRIYPGNTIDNIYVDDNECVGVTTGAPIPQGADAVVKVEDIKLENDFIILDKKIKKYENIRFSGEDVQSGDCIAKKGEKVTPQLLGIFAALGITKLTVFLPPTIGIITTGSELMNYDHKIDEYKIRNSNIILLQALLKKIGIAPDFSKTIGDKKKAITQFLKKLKRLPDMIITTGGVSIGSHDYVKEELENFGVKKLFWKVSQKPGKPTYAGIFENANYKTIFLSLPGNPVAVAVGFYLYALPLINKFKQNNELILYDYAEIQQDIENKNDRTVILNGNFQEGKVKVLSKQGSHILSSLSQANCFVLLEPNQKLQKGNSVKILLL